MAVSGGAMVNQDFVTYSGDDVSPIFTVRNAAGAPIDISSVSNIAWQAARDGVGTPAISKTKSAGQISFVTDGTNGQFQVTITSTDTASLDGFYLHTAKVVDAVGHTTTVTVGRMQVGVRPLWTYDATSLATSPLYQVRRLIGDTKPADQLLFDSEINLNIANYPTLYAAAAACCRDIAASYSREIDIVQAGAAGQLQTNYSQRAKAYLLLAANLEQRGLTVSGSGYAGGISISDKTRQNQNPDRVPPQFNIGMFDDLLPVGPVGNQVPSPGAPDTETFS